jgi:hypothetical protein
MKIQIILLLSKVGVRAKDEKGESYNFFREYARALREHSSCSQVKGDTSTQTNANLHKDVCFARRVAV